MIALDNANKFKNELIIFQQLSNNLLYYSKHKEKTELNEAMVEIEQIYYQIDMSYKDILKNLEMKNTLLEKINREKNNVN